jgi:hypothetical protein
MLAKSKELKTTGAIAVPEGLSGLQDQRLARKFNNEPAPQAVALSYFISLFPNRIQGILRPPRCKTWTTVSKHWPIPDETILSAVAGEEASVWGLRWGEKTRFSVFDIDQGSKYHSQLELQNLLTKLAAVELKAKAYRSSESGGWHVYLFFQDWADCPELQETLKAWLYSQGYEIRNGTLEIFPSGNGLRLPLQPGFAWLDDNAEVITERKELGVEAAISRFLFDLESNANNWEKSKSLIRAQLEVIDRAIDRSVQERQERLDTACFEGLFNYRVIPEKYEEGRRYWKEGLSKSGQRHDAILGIEHYLWHGDQAAGVPALPGEWNDEQRYRVILAWLQENHNGFCNHINRGNWRKVEAQIRRAVKWRRPSGAVQVRTPYPLTENAMERLIALSKSTGRTWSVEDLKKGNDGREAQARKKIREATQLLTKLGQRLTVKGLALASGCSRTTVRRHLDIWKISPVVALSKCTGDQNPFLDLDLLGGGGAVSGGPSGTEEENLLSVLSDADSGDLELDLVENAVMTAPVLANPGPVLELVAQGTYVLGACSPVLIGRWRRRGKATGWRHWGSLASPSRTQPSTGSKHWLLGSVSTCGLNGFLPSSAEPPLGPLHLNPREIFSKGSGLVLLQDDGGSEAGSGRSAIISSQVGQVSETGSYPPAILLVCSRVNSPNSKPLRILVYSDVRGPPKRIQAVHASFERVGTIFGAINQRVCASKNHHGLTCLRNVPDVM